jgi:hypothetical protein
LFDLLLLFELLKVLVFIHFLSERGVSFRQLLAIVQTEEGGKTSMGICSKCKGIGEFDSCEEKHGFFVPASDLFGETVVVLDFIEQSEEVIRLPRTRGVVVWFCAGGFFDDYRLFAHQIL